MSNFRANWLLTLSLILGFALIVVPGDADAQISALVGSGSRQEPDRVIKLTLYPAQPPVPALKHRLYPGVSSLKKGDGVTFYHRAIRMLEQRDRRKDAREISRKKEEGERVPFVEDFIGNLYSELDNKKLSAAEVDELKQAIPGSDSSLFQELQAAAAYRDCDYGFDIVKDRPLWEYISFLLPEVQELRNLARYLGLKAKIEISEGRFDDAVETLRIGLKMSKTTEDNRFLVSTLVGIATASMMLDQVGELVASEGAPSLYWSLETLPRPMVSSRVALEYELEFARNGAGLWFLKDPDNIDFTPAQQRQFQKEIQSFEQMFSYYSRYSGGVVGVSILKGYPFAKRELVSWGYDPGLVESMPVAKVISIHQSRIQREIADEFLKLKNLDYRKGHQAYKELAEQIFSKNVSSGMMWKQVNREVIPCVALLMPGVHSVIQAEGRLERRIAVLQTLEAIRLHAGQTGKLPQQLKDIKIVPVPVSPFTDQPFHYEKKGETAELHEMMEGEVGHLSNSKIYQIQLAK